MKSSVPSPRKSYGCWVLKLKSPKLLWSSSFPLLSPCLAFPHNCTFQLPTIFPPTFPSLMVAAPSYVPRPSRMTAAMPDPHPWARDPHFHGPTQELGHAHHPERGWGWFLVTCVRVWVAVLRYSPVSRLSATLRFCSSCAVLTMWTLLSHTWRCQ